MTISTEVGTNLQTRDLKKLFVNSDKDNCPITRYTILPISGKGLLDINQRKHFVLRDNNLQVKFEKAADFGFVVKAETNSGQHALKRVFLKVVEKSTEEDGALPVLPFQVNRRPVIPVRPEENESILPTQAETETTEIAGNSDNSTV